MAFTQRLTHTNVGRTQGDCSTMRPFSVLTSSRRPSSAPPGGSRQNGLHGNGRGSASLTRLSLPTKNMRMSHSLSPAATTGRVGALRGRGIPRRSRQSIPRRQNSRMTSVATNGAVEPSSAGTLGAGILEPCTRAQSEDGPAVGSQGLFSPMVSEGAAMWSSQEEAVSSTVGMSMPGRLLELVEDRDRAVHLCLQYRCKLRGTEKRLRDVEHRASDLAQQLGAAAAAEGETRKLLDQAMEKAREKENQVRSLEASRVRHEDGVYHSSMFDDARKARLQLTRARRDLRELWLERDELAVLLGQAMQAESDGRERVKKLELVIEGLREQVAGMKNVERGMAQEMAEVEARAASAVKTEQELRSAVLEIKGDFEVLIRDLRQRDMKVQQLEAENATLAAEAASREPARVDAPQYPPKQGVATPAAGIATAIGQDRGTQISYGPGCPVCSARRNENQSGVGTRQASSKGGQPAVAKGPSTNACPVVAAAPTAGRRGTSRARELTSRLDRRKVGKRTEDSGLNDEQVNVVRTKAEHPVAGPPGRLLPRQLTPAASVPPGRVTTLSFPRGGSRIMLNRQAERATPDKRGDIVAMTSVPISTEEEAPEPLLRAAGRVQSVTTPSNPLAAEQASERVLLRPVPPIPCLPPRPHGSAEHTGGLALPPPLVTLQHGRPSDSVEQPRRKKPNPDSTTQIDGDVRRSLFAENNFDEHDSVESKNNRFVVREIVEQRRASGFSPDATTCVKRTPEDNANTAVFLSTGLEAPDCASNTLVPRLLGGIPVLKHGGRGKPKAKTLWVTPDLSEIYYTSVGRTRNSKQTSRMPLAELRAERGRDRGKHPDFSINSSTDDRRFFSLVRIREESRVEASDGGTGTPSAERLAELHPPDDGDDNDARGMRWRVGDKARSVGAGYLLGVAGSSAGTTSRRASSFFSGGARMRERMGFEMASGEERDALVEEINRLAREESTSSSPGLFETEREVGEIA